jgi:hypothetical protein
LSCLGSIENAPAIAPGFSFKNALFYPFMCGQEGQVTREEFSKLNNAEAKAYLLAELKSIVAAETAANKELQEQVGVLLPNIAEGLLKIFK